MRELRERVRRGAVAIYRHPVLVRLTHWVNALCLLVLLVSGLQILNAHPAFYWGETARFADPIAAITSVETPDGALRGELRIGGLRFDTTGVLGVSGAQAEARAFPSWATLPPYPDLGAGRRWHFAFAWILGLNGLAYLVYGFASGRFAGMMWPTGAQMRGLGRSILDHARLRFAHGEAAREYNVLQKLAYLVVIFGLIPVMVTTGLAMSPAMHARLPLLGDLFGGRQSARTFHFIAASGIVGFVAVHVAMVLAAGPINEMRSMLTGWFVVRREKTP